MASVLLSERVEDAVEISLPFALIEKSGSTSNVTEVIGCPGDQVPALDFKRLTAAMKSLSWSPAAGAQAEQVTSHFMELVERSFDLSDPVQKRQAELAVSLMRDNPWLTAN